MVSSADAQVAKQVTPGKVAPKTYAPKTIKKIGNYQGNPSHKTTAGGSRWYNQPESFGEYTGLISGTDPVNVFDAALFNTFIMWQDSAVTYTGPDGIGIGMEALSMAQTFHPQSPLFNDINATPSSAGQIEVTNSRPYTIDSVSVLGFYNRRYTDYVDTMIFTFVTETAGAKFAYFSYAGDVFANHGVDSFAALLYDTSDYQVRPMEQIPYSAGGPSLTGVRFKVPLNDAVFADSFANGLHEISVAPGLNMPAGRILSVSVTFQSGADYTFGDTVTAYNYFAFISHETVAGGYLRHPDGDLNESHMLFKDTSGTNIGNGLGLYTPGMAYTAPYSLETHNISWKVTCATCEPVSVKDVTSTIKQVEAYPNPANTIVNVPFTITKASDVTVSLTNVIGQQVASQSFRNTTGGKAVFNTSSLPNGIYLYTVSANGEKLTKRIVVNN